jgi:plasmid stabilization system protein ParE
MDTGKREVVVSEKYRDDLKNIFQYGVETFGYKGSVLFYENIERIVNNLGSEYFMYPECRFLTSKSRMYRNIILESYLIIYRITKSRIEVLRVFHSSICTKTRIRLVRKINI